VNPENTEPNHPPKALSDEALAWIVRLHSGEAGKASWNDFHAWRAQSAAHEAAAAEAEALWRDASELHRDPVTGLIRPGRRPPAVPRRSVITGLVGLGAAGAGLLWTSGALRLLSSDYSTGVAETRVIDLPDGSRATLNAMSAIGLDYSPQARRIDLVEGQAFFEVGADPFRPFEVRVRGHVVSALGTAFDINSNLPGGSVAVAVSEHAVRVRSIVQINAGNASEGVVVSKDQGVVIAASGRIGTVVRQDATAEAAWRSGMYVAEARPLDEVIVALRAYHHGWIVIREDSLRSLKVSAVLDLRAPDVSLDTLAAGLPIRVSHLSRFLTVISAS
jgi:transmembrane sensor